MKTRCPHCQTTLRISEAQLNAAKGKVRCGKCQQVFNAREYIQPQDETQTAAAVSQKKSPPAPAPQIDWLQQDNIADFEHIDLGHAAPHTDDGVASELPTDIDNDLDLAKTTSDESIDTEVESTLASFETETEDDLNDDIALENDDIPEEAAAPVEHEEVAAASGRDDFSSSGDSLIPGGFNESLQDVEKEFILPGIEPAYEPDQFLNAREEQGLDDLHSEIQRQLETPHEENDAAETDAYDNVLDYLQDVKAQPSKTTAFEKIELSAVPEEPTNAVNWDDAVHLDPEVPASLRSSMQALEKKKKRSTLVTTFMALILFVLIADLGVQTIIFRSFDIATRWPQSRDLLTSVCNYLPCVYSGRREPRKIQLVSRDVRVHPNAKHALLISATVVNQAGYAQPYPRLDVKLSDLSGDVVAEREFLPQEYLKASESRLKLLRPNVPTLITLEVLDPGSEAVNFEFRFL